MTSLWTDDEVERRANGLMLKAKAQVMMNFPLYAALLMRLRVRADFRAKTLYTDGRVLGYNPRYVITRTLEDLVYIIVHEVQHCAFGHPFRCRDKQRGEWNEACDHVVNLIQNRDPRLKMPADGTCDPQYEGLNAEQVYALLIARKAVQQAQENARQGAQQASEQREQQEAQKSAQSAQQSEQDTPQSEQPESASDDASGDAQGESDSDAAEASSDPSEGEQKREAKGDAQARGEGEPQPPQQDVGEGGALGDIIAPGEAPKMPGDDEPTLFDAPPEPSDEGDEQPGDGNASPELDDGAAEPINDASTDEALEREWAEALEAAAIAAGAGSDDVAVRAIVAGRAKRQSFEEFLERFLVQRVQATDDWSRPNRRYADVYLPSQGGYGMKTAVFVIDTSGSITETDLAVMTDATQRIWSQANLRKAVVIFCDSAVRGREEFIDTAPDFTNAPGGGGTRFSPAFREVQDLIDAGEDVAAVIYLTDQDNFRHDEKAVEEYRDLPTLWINPGRTKTPPFGEVCSLLD